MGMYDTVILPTPVKCVQCGTEITSTQTKEFGYPLMRTFHLGDTVESRFLSGVLEEELYCRTCRHIEQNVYIIIYHRILIDVVEDPDDAHARLKRLNINDLIPLYHAMVARLVHWRVGYHHLFESIVAYRDYLRSKQSITVDDNLAICLKAEQPLLCLLKRVEEYATEYCRPLLCWKPSIAKLLKYQHELYERVEAWRVKFDILRRLVKDYVEWIQLPPEEQEDRIDSPLYTFHDRDARECADSDDPLGLLLEKSRTNKVSYFMI